VELHGGTVYAESPGVGQGATFTVQLPLLEEVRSDPVSRSQLHAVVSSVEQTGVEALEDSLTLTLKGLQVLVVDDEPDTREIVSLALEHYAVNVTTAASAIEALKVLEQLKPDVLISDIGMPGEDGYTLIRKVRQLGGQMPAIALTAYAREEDRASALAAGFQCHISKPVEPEQLVAVVAQLAEKIFGAR
jgi:CheY-like chemotaxis protein